MYIKGEKSHLCFCKNCGEPFYGVSPKVKYCSERCKLEGIHSAKVQCVCEVCGKEYLGYPKSNKVKHQFCSDKCRAKYKNTKKQNEILEQRNTEMVGKEGYDYVSCRICGCKMTQLTYHLQRYHNMSTEEYLKQYPDAKITAQKLIDEHLKGEANPMSRANRTDEEIRKSSPFCKEFYEARGIDVNEREKFIKKNQSEIVNTAQIEYYLNKGLSMEEAKKELSERQRTFTLEKCIERYGEEEGTRKFIERQEKWKKSVFANSNCRTSSSVSNISRKFIREVLGDELYDSPEFLHDKTELEIPGSRHVYYYDLTNPKNKRIIEFNGDLWHGNPMLYEEDDINKLNGECFGDIWERDEEKLKTARDNGYEVLVIRDIIG